VESDRACGGIAGETRLWLTALQAPRVTIAAAYLVERIRTAPFVPPSTHSGYRSLRR